MSATQRAARSLKDSLRDVLTLGALPGETAGFTAEEHEEAAEFLLEAMAERKPGQPVVRLKSRGGGEAGNRRMQLVVVNDDMPFLVDSTSQAVAAQGLAVHRILHPVIAVKRDAKGHLQEAGEGYWQHFRFATTFGLLAMAAGIAALLHALVPAMCTHTASRIVRHLGQLLEDRSKIDAIESEAVEARAFVLLLILATAVVAPLWLLGAPLTLKLAYTVLAYALPAVLMVTNPELTSTKEPAA